MRMKEELQSVKVIRWVRRAVLYIVQAAAATCTGIAVRQSLHRIAIFSAIVAWYGALISKATRLPVPVPAAAAAVNLRIFYVS